MLALAATTLLVAPLARADEPTVSESAAIVPSVSVAHESASESNTTEAETAPVRLARVWRARHWEDALGVARVLHAALALQVEADLVLRADAARLDVALRELEAIEEQRTVAQVLGTIGGLVMLVGLGMSVSVNILYNPYPAIAGWTLLGVGGIVALVGGAFHIDVPFRWQRWAASLGRF